MRRVFKLYRSLSVALTCAALLGMTLLQSGAVVAQGSHRLYLPLVMKNYQFIKNKSGIHLGSGVGASWTSTMGSRLTGGNPVFGVYPAVIVMLSSDVFNFSRGGPACRINGVSGLDNSALYTYLTNAARSGSKVIFRLYPSPGNFQNALGAPGTGKILLTTVGARPPKPGGGTGDWCTAGNDMKFRSIDDLAQEMIAIRNYTTGSGWKPYAFDPANEPNTEWFTDNPVAIQTSAQWIAMDTYFKNLYTEVHGGGANPDIRVLAPPMSQSNFAEAQNIIDCSSYPPVSGRAGGLNWMEYSWKESIQLPDGSFVNYNDGWSWHNYWRYGEEGSNSDNACTPNSGHNFQAFPADLKLNIINSPDLAFITEADLYSAFQPGDPSPFLTTKGGSGVNQDGANAANATKVFISQERGADYVAVWNLTISYSDGSICQPGNDEFAWHEAFRSNPASERYWFNAWWLDTTQP